VLSHDNAKARLLELLRALSWQRGEVVLASGKKSDFYIDCKQTALNAEGARLIGQLVFEHAAGLRQAGVALAGVGGLTLGADPIAVAAAVYSAEQDAPLHAFVVRKEPKGHGTRQWLEGGRNLPEGSPVLIVEDVVTSGGSTLKALERTRASGLEPRAVLSLVDRDEGGRATLQATGLPYAWLFSRVDFLEPK
jgi:orotate phosphoribosyltransferase